MENNFYDILKSHNFIGSLIKIKLIIINGNTKDDTEEIYINEGIVKNIYLDEIITISLFNCKINNINYIGIQMFQIIKIIELIVLREGTGEIEDDSFYKLSKPMGNNLKFRSNNKYLSSLMPVQMIKLMQQKQINIPVLIKNKKTIKIFYPKQISSTKVKNENKLICNKIWNNNTPPKLIYYPSDWFYIKNEKNDEKLIKFAMKEISAQKNIGVALRGKNISRWGKVSLITFSTPKFVFTFDLIKLETNYILKFKNILESALIKKIFYDSRCPADYFLNCLNIKLYNIFDIQASNIYFLFHNYTDGLLPKFSYSLPNIINMYLGIDPSFLFFEHRRITHLDEDTCAWFERPLSSEIEFGILCDVIYLLDLKYLIKYAILKPMQIITDIFLNSICRKKFDDYYNILDDTITIPNESAKILPILKSENEYEKMGFIDENVIYQNINQIDPNVIYSKDIIHQNIEL